MPPQMHLRITPVKSWLNFSFSLNLISIWMAQVKYVKNVKWKCINVPSFNLFFHFNICAKRIFVSTPIRRKQNTTCWIVTSFYLIEECREGQAKREECNTCRCVKGGVWSCTKRVCVSKRGKLSITIRVVCIL